MGEKSDMRLTVEECWEHSWMKRFKNGYLRHKMLWDGHSVHLKLYEMTKRMQKSIKTLLFLKDSLGMMDDFVPVNEARNVVTHWTRCLQDTSQLNMIVPRQIKD